MFKNLAKFMLLGVLTYYAVMGANYFPMMAQLTLQNNQLRHDNETLQLSVNNEARFYEDKLTALYNISTERLNTLQEPLNKQLTMEQETYRVNLDKAVAGNVDLQQVVNDLLNSKLAEYKLYRDNLDESSGYEVMEKWMPINMCVVKDYSKYQY